MQKESGFWRLTSGDITYADTGRHGRSMRANILASGGKGHQQVYTWKSTPLPKYLYNANDIKNYEWTAIFRCNNPVDPSTMEAHFTCAFKTGGIHTGSSDPRASCVDMETATTETLLGKTYGVWRPRFARELNHPNYDYVNVDTQFMTYLVTHGKTVGLKHLGYQKSSGFYHKLMVDRDPINADGSLANNYVNYAQYTDINGKSTGRYAQNATWGSYMNTLRIDGYQTIDLFRLNIREIIPPS
jgi:hypothetical protein